MKSFGILSIVALIIAAIAAMNTFFVVDQREQALVLQVGAAKETYNAPGEDQAGLKMKIPFVQSVVKYDKRNLGLDIPDIEVYASNQEQLLVDAFVRWRIDNPLAFYQTLNNMTRANRDLSGFTETAIRKAIANRLPEDVISGQRAELMDEIRSDLRASVEGQAGAEEGDASLGDLGISIIDVRIRRADLPADVSERVFERMNAARQQRAEQIRAEGEERAKLIRATAEKERTVLLAQANEQSEIIRGEGDAKRNEIYASAYEKDPEFFRFQRALIACEKSYTKGTQIVVAPDNMGLCDEFIRRARNNGTPQR